MSPREAAATLNPRTKSRGGAWRRVRGIARANLLLTRRNKLTLTYAVAVPLLPLLILLTGDGDDRGRLAALTSSMLMGWLFPVFYNLLSMVVSRRDELVLKRLRTGELRDAELVAGMAVPGFGLCLVLAAMHLVLALVLGWGVVNPVLLLATVLLGCLMFAGFALWTASWTRTAESAQITSMPVLLLGTVGLLAPVFPAAAQTALEWTPGLALHRLLGLSWFGLDPSADAAAPGLSFAGTWAEAVQPLVVVALWLLVALLTAYRSMRWEPRA